jgi:hypothetical protein
VLGYLLIRPDLSDKRGLSYCRWIKPATSVLIIGTILNPIRSRTDLVVENILLRQQLIVLNRQVK